MIIYGVMTDTSVPKLYLGGFIPGLILTVLFSLVVLIACLWRPDWGGRKVRDELAASASARCPTCCRRWCC